MEKVKVEDGCFEYGSGEDLGGDDVVVVGERGTWVYYCTKSTQFHAILHHDQTVRIQYNVKLNVFYTTGNPNT
jgi:hypothetical protein